MSEIKIPNCPCCDGESKLHDYGGGDFRDGGKQYFIKCEKCGLTTKHSSSKDEVLMTWGKRKPMERIVKKVTEKMKMHKRIRDEYEDLLGETTKTVQDKAVEVCEKILKIVKEEGGIE